MGLAGFQDTKIDTVVIRGVNDDELADLIEFGKSIPAEVRFIEYMDVGGATHWSTGKVMSPRPDAGRALRRRYGRIEPIRAKGKASLLQRHGSGCLMGRRSALSPRPPSRSAPRATVVG